MLIVTSDDLAGIEEAIRAVYPDAEYQGCVVHVIRNSLKQDMKGIYKAPTQGGALMGLEELERKWADKYPLAVRVWRKNWGRIRLMFRFTPEIRRLIYTTNIRAISAW